MRKRSVVPAPRTTLTRRAQTGRGERCFVPLKETQGPFAGSLCEGGRSALFTKAGSTQLFVALAQPWFASEIATRLETRTQEFTLPASVKPVLTRTATRCPLAFPWSAREE